MPTLAVPAPAQTSSVPDNVTITSAYGWHLHTSAGTRIFDACSGAVNVNVGYGHPRVIAAMEQQLRRNTFVLRAGYQSEPAHQLRTELTRLSNGRLTTHLLSNSGSDGVEQAYRVALRHFRERGQHRRTVILGEDVSYHGITAAALVSSGHGPRHEALGTWAPAASRRARVPAPAEPGERPGPAAWREAIRRCGSQLAAVVIEPVGGAASGAAPLDAATAKAIRAAATEVGALVIADEVMTGGGRTGCWLASDERGLEADIVVVSKGIGAGYFPVASCMVTPAVAAPLQGLPDLGTFGHTMSESPLGAAAALAVLSVVREDSLVTRAYRSGLQLRRGLAEALAGRPLFGAVRGAGLLLAVQVHVSPQDLPALTRRFRDHGIAVYPAGVDQRTSSLIIAPPLTITEDGISELLATLTTAIDAIEPELESR